MRLGFAIHLGTVRFLGTFLEQPTDVPAQAIAFMAGQLGIQAAGLLAEYASSEWRWNHPTEIRDRYGYRAFSDPFVQFRLNRWLYALCWTGSDRPSSLFGRYPFTLPDAVARGELRPLRNPAAHGTDADEPTLT